MTRVKTSQLEAGVKLRDADKMALIPVKVVPSERETMLRKPDWLKIRLPKSSEKIDNIKKAMRSQGLSSVCEEASCPNLPECFNHGTATFMILGAICTRRCPFCDVAHGRPLPPSAEEPEKLALTIKEMKLKYVVITSVDRDDLRDGGAQHFADCVTEIRKHNPGIKIEILVPDFRGRMDTALEILSTAPPDVFNHNLETVPGLYPTVRPGARYFHSLRLLDEVKRQDPSIFTKSGLMVGLGEEAEEVRSVMDELRAVDVDFLTIGQYLQPTPKHHAIARFVTPDEFAGYQQAARGKGFLMVSATPLTRSSYHAGDDFARLRAAREAKLAGRMQEGASA